MKIFAVVNREEAQKHAKTVEFVFSLCDDCFLPSFFTVCCGYEFLRWADWEGEGGKVDDEERKSQRDEENIN